jgi:hypothetical protein
MCCRWVCAQRRAFSAVSILQLADVPEATRQRRLLLHTRSRSHCSLILQSFQDTVFWKAEFKLSTCWAVTSAWTIFEGLNGRLNFECLSVLGVKCCHALLPFALSGTAMSLQSASGQFFGKVSQQ